MKDEPDVCSPCTMAWGNGEGGIGCELATSIVLLGARMHTRNRSELSHSGALTQPAPRVRDLPESWGLR